MISICKTKIPSTVEEENDYIVIIGYPCQDKQFDNIRVNEGSESSWSYD